MSIENNKLLIRNEEDLKKGFANEIFEIVNYITDSLKSQGLSGIRVKAKSHYMNQIATHIVCQIIGVGHGTIELQTLTRNNINERIESIATMFTLQLSKPIVEKETTQKLLKEIL